MLAADAYQFALALAITNRHPDPESFAQEVASHIAAPDQAQTQAPSSSVPIESEVPHSWESAQS